MARPLIFKATQGDNQGLCAWEDARDEALLHDNKMRERMQHSNDRPHGQPIREDGSCDKDRLAMDTKRDKTNTQPRGGANGETGEAHTNAKIYDFEQERLRRIPVSNCEANVLTLQYRVYSATLGRMHPVVRYFADHYMDAQYRKDNRTLNNLLTYLRSWAMSWLIEVKRREHRDFLRHFDKALRNPERAMETWRRLAARKAERTSKYEMLTFEQVQAIWENQEKKEGDA